MLGAGGYATTAELPRVAGFTSLTFRMVLLLLASVQICWAFVPL